MKAQQASKHMWGHESQKFWNEDIGKGRGEIIDLDLRRLPEKCNAEALRRAANVRHVIASEVETDNVKGTCAGAGRIRVRLSEGETEK